MPDSDTHPARAVEVERRVCPSCGAAAADGRYCTKCGAELAPLAGSVNGEDAAEDARRATRRRPTRWMLIASAAAIAAVAAAAAVLLVLGGEEGSPDTKATGTAGKRSVRVEPRFRAYATADYRAQVPTGDAWSAPAESEPVPGRLFRTTVRGPGGAFVLIERTPNEPARFGGSYASRRRVPQSAFGSAVEYVFAGGKFDRCRTSRCIDYIMNDRNSDAGYAVLAGGPDFALAQTVARRVMRSLAPLAETPPPKKTSPPEEKPAPDSQPEPRSPKSGPTAPGDTNGNGIPDSDEDGGYLTPIEPVPVPDLY